MTGAQVSYLKLLSEQAEEPEAFSERLTRNEASVQIERLEKRLDANRAPDDTSTRGEELERHALRCAP